MLLHADASPSAAHSPRRWILSSGYPDKAWRSSRFALAGVDLAGEQRESLVAKATYVRARGVWRVFWQRRDLKWHSYEPQPEVESVEESRHWYPRMRTPASLCEQ